MFLNIFTLRSIYTLWCFICKHKICNMMNRIINSSTIKLYEKWMKSERIGVHSSFTNILNFVFYNTLCSLIMATCFLFFSLKEFGSHWVAKQQKKRTNTGIYGRNIENCMQTVGQLCSVWCSSSRLDNNTHRHGCHFMERRNLLEFLSTYRVEGITSIADILMF